jgi:eukaryotic-like serine/threonine-protein kinase
LRRFFTFVLGALAMLAVALTAMFITMRVAIHGREALVPSLTGLSVADAGRAAGQVGLRLAVENRFYSAEVPAGHILAQDPAPGSRVRREWAVRVTESLGAQRVSVPDLTGGSERVANVTIRRLGLEPGTVARIAIPGDAGVVIAQSPAPNSAGADSPRVSLLVSGPANAQPQAYVMPQFIGLTYAVAANRAAAAGLHLEVAQPAPPPASNSAAPNPASSTASPQPGSPQPVPPLPSAPVIHPGSIITAQTPQAGRRVQQGDAVHIAVEDIAQPLATTVTHAN